MTRVCHEEVSRKGELQPCEKSAVAKRFDGESWYPVCTGHTRGPCLPLSEPRWIATPADLENVDLTRYVFAGDGVAFLCWDDDFDPDTHLPGWIFEVPNRWPR